ncbi:MAG: NAD(P)/FAD-dependent oxidoreductase [Lachnospirales bacterium]
MARPFHNPVIILGAGAAGMLAAAAAAADGANVLLLEKNSRPGRKIGITGKGRCNVTNAAAPQEFMENIISNPRFLYSAFHGFSNHDLMDLLEEQGVPLKVERGERVFPVSDKARDVVDALVGLLRHSRIRLRTGVAVREVVPVEGRWLVKTAEENFWGQCVIIATGGASYSATGSTGDGYLMAKALGHTVRPLRPGLVPFVSDTPWVRDLKGLSLKNVEIRITTREGEEITRGFGEMLFTHFGVSGPIILSASSRVQYALEKKKRSWKDAGFTLHLNLKPALSQEQLDRRLLRDFGQYRDRTMEHAMKDLLPRRLIAVVLAESGIAADLRAQNLSRVQRQCLGDKLRDLSIPITGTRPLEEAIITMGGVDTTQVNPKTMESKIHPGLYFAGEVLDVDALTGGFNLQIAFSTGVAAGKAAAQTGRWE